MKTAVTILIATLLSLAAPAQTAEEIIAKMTEGKAAEVGVAWVADGKTHTVNNTGHYPLMSVFKLHVAVAALRQMERSGTPTDTLINVKASEMMADTYSPMLRLYGKRDFTIRLDSLLRYSVAESDNNACDIIIRLAGGIEAVDAEMRSIGLTDFNLTETEATMHADPTRSYNNRSTPLSVAELFRKLYEESILGEPYAALLKGILLSTSTGPNKLKAALTPGMTLAHKTGTGFTLPDGTRTADNDAGAITLPDGHRIYIAVLIKDTRLGDEANARLMADVAKVVIGHTAKGVKGVKEVKGVKDITFNCHIQ